MTEPHLPDNRPGKIAVCAAHELGPGQRRLLTWNNAEIALLNVDGSLYAFRNRCPHQGAPMICGPVTGTMLPSAPQTYRYGCHNEIIRCPLHGWEFDMATGKSLFSPGRVSIKTYPVTEEDGQLFVHFRDRS